MESKRNHLLHLSLDLFSHILVSSARDRASCLSQRAAQGSRSCPRARFPPSSRIDPVEADAQIPINRYGDHLDPGYDIVYDCRAAQGARSGSPQSCGLLAQRIRSAQDSSRAG